jgi:DGQHR domain-containing protein
VTTITIIAQEVKNLDTVCYIGSASIADLARISQADVFDQVDNPDGLQRELSLKHAYEAYQYVARDRSPELPRAYPDLALNVRDKKVIERETVFENGDLHVVRLTFDVEKIHAARTVKVSRMDGNHRLVFAGGDGKEREPLGAAVPFQLHIGLTRAQETSLFSDINANQKGLNTSHLAILRSRITPEEQELLEHPARVFAHRLNDDVSSPWHGLVHLGGPRFYRDAEGKRHPYPYRPVTFIALEHGVQRVLRKSQYLHERDFDGQYGMLRNYWQAVKAVFPEAWESPKDYLVLKNIGVQAFGLLGATVIDRCSVTGNVDVGHMVPFLQAAKPEVDWHKDSKDVAGMSGNRAALLLSAAMAKNLPKTADEYIDLS